MASPQNLNSSLSYAGHLPSSTPFSTPRQAVSGDIQRHADELRARNQLADHDASNKDLTIGDLRRDEGLREIVSGIENSLKTDIPALSSAPTARMSPNGPFVQQSAQPDIGGIAPLVQTSCQHYQPQPFPPPQNIPLLPSVQPAQDLGQQQQGGLQDGQHLGAIQKARPTTQSVVSNPQHHLINPPVVSGAHSLQQQQQVNPHGVSGHPTLPLQQHNNAPLVISPQNQPVANIPPFLPTNSDP